MPSSKQRITTYVSKEEYQQIASSAVKAGLPLSTFVKRVCLCQTVTSTVDHTAVLAVLKANADLGRLGGLLKMALTEKRAETSADELRYLLKKIEKTKDQVEKKIEVLVKKNPKKE